MDTCRESLVAACEATKLNRSSYPPSEAITEVASSRLGVLAAIDLHGFCFIDVFSCRAFEPTAAHTAVAHFGDTASMWVLQR